VAATKSTGSGVSAPEASPSERDKQLSVADSIAAVVVNHEAGDDLLACVASLRAEGVVDVIVVDNASSDGSAEALLSADGEVRLVLTGTNLGYGAAANRGVDVSGREFVLVSNPDVAVHRGALWALAEVLRTDPTLAIVGPRILEADGTRYPSARRFPSFVDAIGHALLGDLIPGNRFTRRYRLGYLDAETVTDVDWVSGACFLARRRALQELKGFDESYFMYAEDTDLCWRARRAGWGVLFVPGAVVTHLQGLSTGRRPYRMLLAHHRSVFHFAARTEQGWRRLALPPMAVFLALRLAAMCARQALSALHGTSRRAE
jgi:N-acetylglucosaminyl-diphospho-decaprenol L-rhamnosyltransferase